MCKRPVSGTHDVGSGEETTLGKTLQCCHSPYGGILALNFPGRAGPHLDGAAKVRVYDNSEVINKGAYRYLQVVFKEDIPLGLRRNPSPLGIPQEHHPH